MTWHLKDRELEKKLIELYPGFLDDLNFSVRNKGNFPSITLFCMRVRGYEKIPQDEISFWLDELEEDPPGYNPNGWNEYPKVTPPENVWMRLEICPGSEDSGRVGAKYVNGKWMLDDGTIENFGNYPARFRPWSED